jgi:hypothetical protein
MVLCRPFGTGGPFQISPVGARSDPVRGHKASGEMAMAPTNVLIVVRCRRMTGRNPPPTHFDCGSFASKQLSPLSNQGRHEPAATDATARRRHFRLATSGDRIIPAEAFCRTSGWSSGCGPTLAASEQTPACAVPTHCAGEGRRPAHCKSWDHHPPMSNRAPSHSAGRILDQRARREWASEMPQQRNGPVTPAVAMAC